MREVVLLHPEDTASQPAVRHFLYNRLASIVHVVDGAHRVADHTPPKSPSRAAAATAGVAVIIAALAGLAHADPPDFQSLGPAGDPRCHADSLWVDSRGRELFVGCSFASSPDDKDGTGTTAMPLSPAPWIAHSKDGGVTFVPRTATLPLPSGTRSPVFAIWGRNPRDVWAVGYGGSLWHTDGDERWLRVDGAGRTDLFAVAGNAHDLVVAAGDHGWAFVSHRDARFVRERTGCRGRIRAVWVGEDGRVVVASERGELAERGAKGRWRVLHPAGLRATRTDVFAGLVEEQRSDGARGGLVVLSEAGRLLRRGDGEAAFRPLPALPLASRSYCDALAFDGRLATLLCHRAAPCTELRKEPPMEPYLLVGERLEGPWREQPVPGPIGTLWARPGSGVTWAMGTGLWRRE